ncbi:MAG: hypothetical protein WHW07_03485 [Bacteroidales bacterium]
MKSNSHFLKDDYNKLPRYFRLIVRNLPWIVITYIFVILLVNDFGTKETHDILNNSNVMYYILGITVLLFNFVFQYLESDKSSAKYASGLYEELNELRQIIRNTNRTSLHDKEILEEIRNLKNKIGENKTAGLDLNESEKIKLFELFESKLEKNLSKEFLEAIQQKFGSKIIASEQHTDLLNDLFDIKDRMRIEIKKLSLRANTNLAIGSATTFVALIVLYITVVSNHTDFTNTLSLSSFIIPRISLVVFIEVFAFFFLKLYKSSLDNIRYYHNEMTNIETRIIALKSATINADKTCINDVIKEFSKTERNFIIKKGETTIELERLRRDKSESKSLIDFARSIIIKHTEK